MQRYTASIGRILAQYGKQIALLLVLLESMFCVLIIKKVAYTEIDWQAYMQEVSGFLSGERNYLNLKGDTGPLVYPAGFVYLFSGLYHLTQQGENILLAQYLFALLYLVNLAIVFVLFFACSNSNNSRSKSSSNSNKLSIVTSSSSSRRAEEDADASTTTAAPTPPTQATTTTSVTTTVPLWLLFALVMSKRVHSIYVLRMFNDCFAVLFGYAAVYCFTKHQYRLGSLLYSLGVSIKMNMLLYAPGVLLVYLTGTGLRETIVCLSICALTQIVLAIPFLTTFPIEYISRSFDLGRVFMYKWTVNFKFLSEEQFVGKPLSFLLLGLTVVGMVAFYVKWIRAPKTAIESNSSGSVSSWSSSLRQLLQWHAPRAKLDAYYTVVTIFFSNFIGICFARTLHYQFYCWYFHTLPFLLWHARLPTFVSLLVLVAIEVAFNVYPSTPFSSALLQVAHAVLLIALFAAPVPFAFGHNAEEEQEATLKTEKIKLKAKTG